MRISRSSFHAVVMAGAISCAIGIAFRTTGAVEAPGSAAVTLPGGAPGIGFDDLRFAPSLGLILAPAGRSGFLDLVEPASGKVTSVPGFSETGTWDGGHDQGVTSADEGAGFLFATDRTSGDLAIVDPKSRRIASRTKLGGPPDYVRFVPATRELWVTSPDRERIEVFRLGKEGPPTAVSDGFVPIPGGPESLVIDAKRGRAYTHLWDGETDAIDLVGRKIVAKWKNGCRGSRGIALDEERGFLFTGCAEGKATVLSVTDGHEISTASSGNGVDIIDYDSAAKRLYFPGGKSATMAIFDVSAEGKLSLRRIVTTSAGSHCVAVAPNGTAYVCDPRKGRLLAFRETTSR